MSEPDYENLATFLANYSAVLAAGLDDVSKLDGLAGEVKLGAVKALLLARDPYLLDPENPEKFVEFFELLNGIGIEVEAIVGTDPTGIVRRLALWAITVGVAAAIDGSLYPEQGGNDSASALQVRYLAALKALRGSGGEGSVSFGGPLGSFPAPYRDVEVAPFDSPDLIVWPY